MTTSPSKQQPYQRQVSQVTPPTKSASQPETIASGYSKQSEPITDKLVLRQISTNALPKNLTMVAEQAARVHASLILQQSSSQDQVTTDENKKVVKQDDLAALNELRSYQTQLAALCIADKVKTDKYVQLMVKCHQDFHQMLDQQLQQKDNSSTTKMEVDEWDQQQNNEEHKGTDALSASTSSGESRRDEFSYSLLESLLFCKQMIQAEDQTQIQHYNEKVKGMFLPLFSQGLISQQMAHEILDRTTVEHIGMGNAEIMRKCLIQYRTFQFYAQNKFNLMREECEGFSKLIIELNQENIDQTTLPQVKDNIQKLVGYFQLDPNRLLDLILTSFQYNVRNLAYLDLIKEFGQRDQVTQLLGFKLQYALEVGCIGPDGFPKQLQTTDEEGNVKSAYDLVDQSLFDLAAILIKYEVVDLDDIWPHIESKMDPKPSDDQPDEIDQLKEQQIKSLDYLYQLLFKTIMNTEQFEREMQEAKIDQKHIVIENNRAKMHCNFKVRLLQSCIRVNDWETTDLIVNGIYDGKFDLTWSQPLLKAIFNALDWCVSKIFSQVNPARKVLPNRFGDGKFKLKSQVDYFNDDSPKSIRQATEANSALFDDLKRILSICGVYIALDERVFQKVLKVVHHALTTTPALKQSAILLAQEVFVPAQALVSTNFAVEQAVWAIFQHADFNQRYTCYTQMLKMTYLSQPYLIAKQITVHKQFSKWANRLVDASENRTKCKQFMRIANGNFLLAFDLMVAGAKAYENQIEAQISAISLCQDMALDQMGFMIVKNLGDSTENPLDMNQNVAKWLMNITDLASQFFKKFPQVEITGLFTYLIHKLRDENAFVLGYMINQIVAKMFGWSDLDLNQLQPDQLNVLAAGFVLMLNGRNQSQQLRSNKKSTEALVSLFWNTETNDHQKIGLRLMVQLAQQAQYVSNKFDTEQLILVARQYDKMQVYFAHMVDTLNFLANSQKKFALLLPENAARSLSYDYRLPPQHVFQVLRCALPPIYKLTPEVFNTQVAAFKEVLDLSTQSRLEAALSSENTEDNDYWDEIAFLTCKKEELWHHLRPELYCIFWFMNIQSLLVPDKLYKDDIKSLSDQIKKLNDQVTQLKSSRLPLDAMRTSAEPPKETIKKCQKEIEKHTRSQRELQREYEGQTQQYKDTYAFLQTKIPDLFKNEETSEDKQPNNMHELSTVLIQYCFFPRLMHSAKDALFSFQFCKLLHKLRVPNFNFLSFFGQILKCIVPAIHFCSEDEAENLGIFFLELFKQLQHWSKKDVWERECQGYGGFARKLTNATMCISHQEFVDKIMTSINKRISAAMCYCFENAGKTHMKARCALIILNRVSPIFPNKYQTAKAIQEKLQTLVDTKEGTNQDLKTLAGRLNEKLKKKVQTFPEYAVEEKAKKDAASKVAAAAAKDESKSRANAPSTSKRHQDSKDTATPSRTVKESTNDKKGGDDSGRGQSTKKSDYVQKPRQGGTNQDNRKDDHRDRDRDHDKNYDKNHDKNRGVDHDKNRAGDRGVDRGDGGKNSNQRRVTDSGSSGVNNSKDTQNQDSTNAGGKGGDRGKGGADNRQRQVTNQTSQSNQPSSSVSKSKAKAEDKQSQREVLEVKKASSNRVDAKQDQPPYSSTNRTDSQVPQSSKKPQNSQSHREETKQPISVQQPSASVTQAGNKRQPAQSASQVLKDDKDQPRLSQSFGGRDKKPPIDDRDSNKRQRTTTTPQDSAKNLTSQSSTMHLRDNESLGRSSNDNSSKRSPSHRHDPTTKSGKSPANDQKDYPAKDYPAKDYPDKDYPKGNNQSQASGQQQESGRQGANNNQPRGSGQDSNYGGSRGGGDYNSGGRNQGGADSQHYRSQGDNGRDYHGGRDHQSHRGGRNYDQGYNRDAPQQSNRDRNEGNRGMRSSGNGAAGNRNNSPPRRGQGNTNASGNGQQQRNGDDYFSPHNNETSGHGNYHGGGQNNRGDGSKYFSRNNDSNQRNRKN